MNKFFAFVFILLIAPLFGALYGILHDQLTYSISPEYYTKFKFVQFGFEYMGLGENIGSGKTPEIRVANPRAGVAIVGVLATWWMGMILGATLALVALIHKNGNTMFKETLKAILLTMAVALATGILGLAFGKLFLLDNPPNWYLPDNLIDRDHFILVGSMHNFSYLGGVLGLIVGIVYLIKRKQN